MQACRKLQKPRLIKARTGVKQWVTLWKEGLDLIVVLVISDTSFFIDFLHSFFIFKNIALKYNLS